MKPLAVNAAVNAAVSGGTLLMMGEHGSDVRPVYLMRYPLKYSWSHVSTALMEVSSLPVLSPGFLCTFMLTL